MKNKILKRYLVAGVSALLISLSLHAQKTPTSIVGEVLNMTGVSGTILGYEVDVVVSDPFGLYPGRYTGFVFTPTDVKRANKTTGTISYTLTSVSKIEGSYASNAAESFTNMNKSNITNIGLTLSRSTLVSQLSELGSFSYNVQTSTANYQVTYFLNSSTLSVLEPNATYPGGYIFGRATCRVKNLATNSSSTSREGVIYLTVKYREIDG